jgi:hypothetical protein
MQLVARSQAALTDVLVALGLFFRQEQAAEKCHEQDAGDHDGAAQRREIEQFERFVAAEHQ